MYKHFRFSQKTRMACVVLAVLFFVEVPLTAVGQTVYTAGTATVTTTPCTPPFCQTTTSTTTTSTTSTNSTSISFNTPVALVLTWGDLAIIGIVAFIVGLVSTVVIMLAKRSYGIITVILREVGYSYKVVYQHKYSGTQKDFRKFNRTYHIDLSRTAWLDWANRPVLFYELETLTPVKIGNTSKRLTVVLQAMKIEMSKKGMRPSDPFDLLFGRKLMEMLFLAIRRKTRISTGVYLAFVVIIILAAVTSYLLGNLFPVVHLAPPVASNSTSITNTTSTLSGVHP